MHCDIIHKKVSTHSQNFFFFKRKPKGARRAKIFYFITQMRFVYLDKICPSEVMLMMKKSNSRVTSQLYSHIYVIYYNLYMEMLELLTFTKQYLILSFFYPRLSYNCLGRRRKCCSPETCEQALKKSLINLIFTTDCGCMFSLCMKCDLLQGSRNLE